MKRYQCIKNVIDVNYRGHSYISFSAGSIYKMDDDGNMLDNDRFKALFLPSELKEHFQELMDLRVDDYADRDYNPADEYTVDADEVRVYRKEGLGINTGCAIVIAVALTVIVSVLYYLFI